MPRKQKQQVVIHKPELTRDEVREFERELEDWKLSAVMSNPLEYYGRPLKDQEKFNGFVISEVIGGVHWSVVDYAQKNHCIGKRKNGWVVITEGREPIGDKGEMWFVTRAYDAFIRKWKALDDLKNKRAYAEKQGLEELENLDVKSSIPDDLFSVEDYRESK
mgnify:CR=1 FL=1